LPKPQEAPSFKPVDIVIPKQESNTTKERKNCIVCAALIPKQAKFCNKCGNSQ
jgi:rRNA maturation endonuclease Nob1